MSGRLSQAHRFNEGMDVVVAHESPADSVDACCAAAVEFDRQTPIRGKVMARSAWRAFSTKIPAAGSALSGGEPLTQTWNFRLRNSGQGQPRDWSTPRSKPWPIAGGWTWSFRPRRVERRRRDSTHGPGALRKEATGVSNAAGLLPTRRGWRQAESLYCSASRLLPSVNDTVEERSAIAASV